MRLIIFILFLLISWSPVVAIERYLVFAAASMKDALEEIATGFERETGDKLILSFAGTAKLARQIDKGAPADIFVSADNLWMDWLVEQGRVAAPDRQIIAGNILVIAVRAEIQIRADPLTVLTGGLTAIADPDTIPAGRYGKQALIRLGLWQKVAKNAVRTENVRLALALVARGEVEAAIVYRSDVSAEPRVKVIYQFMKEDHQKIIYPAAVVKGAKKGAGEVLNYLVSQDAQKIFAAHGFQPVENQEN